MLHAHSFGRNLRLTLLALTLAAPTCFSQLPAPVTVPQFDVISVKPDKTDSGMTRLGLTPNGFNADNVGIHMLLLEGYQLNEDQLIGEPAWIKTDRFDIQAKVAGPDVEALSRLSFNQRRSMFKQILVEQFHLTTHTEIRQLPVYLLTVAKGGVKFKVHVPDPAHPERENGQGSFSVSSNKIVTQGTTMAYFLAFLAQAAGRTFVDKTGLTGTYDITLRWTPDDAPPPLLNGAPDPNPPPDIFTAIQEQLGLKLESSKGSVPVLVIDHIERPTPN